VYLPWNSNLCGNSGSLGVTTLHVLQKNTSRQLNKSRFSTLIGTNLRQLFHERVFFFSSFYLPSRHVCRTLSSRRFVVPAKRSVIWSTPSPLRRTAAPRLRGSTPSGRHEPRWFQVRAIRFSSILSARSFARR
jgi:hypothetical protein